MVSTTQANDRPSSARPARKRPQAVSLTEAAAQRVRDLVASADKPVLGLRLGVKSRGCSGLSYKAEYATDQRPGDEVVDVDGVKVFIDAGASMFLIGTQIGFEDTALYTGFTFRNPNETGRCGCGESFTVGETKQPQAAALPS